MPHPTFVNIADDHSPFTVISSSAKPNEKSPGAIDKTTAVSGFSAYVRSMRG